MIYSIDDISARLYPYHENIENSGGLWEEKLSEYNDIETIVGSYKKLTDEMKMLLEENNLDEEDGFDIRNHIIDANRKIRVSGKNI